MKDAYTEMRKEAALWGALIGDALGVPVEFRSRSELSENPVTDMRGYGTHGQPAGTWSDDSSLLLCTVESLAECGGLEVDDLAKRFVRWKHEGHWGAHGKVFDIGVATSEAIARLAAGVPPERAGGIGQYDNGNGSLMRILPIALAFAHEEPEALAHKAERASSLTHRHWRSQMACAFYCLYAQQLLRGVSPGKALEETVAIWSRRYQKPPFTEELLAFLPVTDGRLAKRSESEMSGSGYVIHTLTASLWCLLTSHSYEETVLKAVNLGLDTDTTGTVAGGLAGLAFGFESVPERWKRQLARHDEVAALIGKFLNPEAEFHRADAQR